MEEYGDLDEETGEFTYKEEHSKLIPIIADDVTGIFTDTGSNNIKNENSHQLAIKLKDLAKVYNDNRIGSAFFKYLYQSYWAHELLRGSSALPYMPTG
jgi:hypothetical protein